MGGWTGRPGPRKASPTAVPERPYNPILAGQLFRVLDANREYLDPWIGLPRRPPTVEACRNYLIEQADRQRRGRLVGGTIIYRDEIVGDARFATPHWADSGHAVGLAYWIAEGAQGRGIVSRVCRELVTLAWATSGIKRVEISTAVHNKRSRRLAERLGFQLDGILRNEMKHGDDIYDLAVYSTLAHEWLGR